MDLLTLIASGALGQPPNVPEPNPALSTLAATHCKAAARRIFLPMESRKEKFDQWWHGEARCCKN